jgi:hypothetical protein
MRTHLVSLLVLALAASVAAQPAPCSECARGEALIEHFSLQPLRPVASELTSLTLPELKLTPDQYALVVDLRRRVPATQRLGAVDEADLPAIAASLCGAATGGCVATTTRVLLCLADRCTVDFPPEKKPPDLLELPPECDRYRRNKRSPVLGVGFDWGNGVHSSQFPNDGRAWSVGIETRLRLSNRLGAVGRIDRISGRDEATDVDANGSDDTYTGSITRITMLAGPSVVLLHEHYEGSNRFLRVDLLGGRIATSSQPGETGFAAGVDVSYELSVVRMGMRAVRGLGDANDASMLIGHLGLMVGGGPLDHGDINQCRSSGSGRSRLALGFGWTVGGYGIPRDLGYIAAGIGVEAAWYLSRSIDALAHADLLVFPGDERDRSIHQALLGGLRIDHGARKGKRSGVGFFSSAMAGYTHGAMFSPTTAGTGPVADLSVGWGIQSGEGASNLQLHGRFGISEGNFDYRAIFLTFGLELRFDPRTWRGRT